MADHNHSHLSSIVISFSTTSHVLLSPRTCAHTRTSISDETWDIFRFINYVSIQKPVYLLKNKEMSYLTN